VVKTERRKEGEASSCLVLGDVGERLVGGVGQGERGQVVGLELGRRLLRVAHQLLIEGDGLVVVLQGVPLYRRV
jgi:hypothetical protein